MISWAEARRQEGFKQGLEQGFEQGFNQGFNQGLGIALLRQIERRFSVTNADRERVRAASDREKLQAALDEVTEPESVLRLLE